MKVKANKNSRELGIGIRELGRIAQPGEVFEIEESRVDIIVNGKNYYNLPLAEPYVEKPKAKEEVKEEVKEEIKEEAE